MGLGPLNRVRVQCLGVGTTYLQKLIEFVANFKFDALQKRIEKCLEERGRSSYLAQIAKSLICGWADDCSIRREGVLVGSY